jgi:dTDP-4-dehydrorhamnose reductase
VPAVCWGAWQDLLRARGVPFVSVGRERLDLSQPGQVAQGLPDSARLVVNCAAYCDVERAEDEEPKASRVNGEAVGELSHRCRELGATLVHYSTDYVFDGQGNVPYTPTAARAPLSAYGRSKALGEVALETSGADSLLVRTSWLYAPWAKNFVLTMRRLGQEKPLLRVVDDQRGRPTSATSLARATWALLEKRQRGTVHVCDDGECTWFEFARWVVQVSGGSARVEPCSSAEYPQKALRPRYSVMDLSATERVIGALPHWRENVKAALSAAATL